uniref:Anaphase-promoting complex subunit 4-like WD40 domain-containing protein n=1 Tax=Scleropages formosus TaxID=113540 RepID=A0A8C9RIA0_SCLFO
MNAADSPESPCSRVRRFSSEIPSASSLAATTWRHRCTTEYDDVCQRLSLDSPPHGVENYQLHLPSQETSPLRDMEQEPGRENADSTVSAAFGKSRESCQARINGIKTTEETCIWKEFEGSEAQSSQLWPFSVLETPPSMPCSHIELELRLAVPGMQDDYYLNLLAWSEQSLVALGLGSTVYVWNSEVQALQGSLHVRPPTTLVSFTSSLYSWSSISSVAWSKDGHILAIGKHDGEIQLWDVEYKSNIRNVTGHLSLVGSLSFNQQILSSGSLLGFIHHHDVRVAIPVVGWIQQQKGICGLQWCPDGTKLASGTSDGLLSIWPNDPGTTQKCLPLLTRQHLTAVKVRLFWSYSTSNNSGKWVNTSGNRLM